MIITALPMASAVHCQLNPQVRPFVPTAMTPKQAYRRGKREEGEQLVNKHHIHSGRWTGRRGVGRLNPRRENKIQGKNGDRERGENSERAMDYVRRAVWGMLYADDACIVS